MLVLDGIYYVVAIVFFVYLFVYFWTSEGGPTLLAMTLVPVTFVLFVLNSLREDDLYPRLPPAANYAIAAVYIALRALRRLLHAHRILRARHRRAPASWIAYDLFVGGADDGCWSWNMRASATCRCSCSTSC